MAKIFNLFVGDTWTNSNGKPITVQRVLSDGHVMVSSPSYTKLYKIETRSTIYNINSGTYKEFMSIIPDVFLIQASPKDQKGKTLYTLCRSLLHKFYNKGLLESVPRLQYNDYLYYNKSNKELTVVPEKNAHYVNSNTPLEIVEYEKFVSIYNSLSIKLKEYNGKINQENREQRGERTVNPCGEIQIDTKRADSSESSTADEGQIRISSQIRKIGIEKGSTGSKIRFKGSRSRIKIPSVEWRVQHRKICRA